METEERNHEIPFSLSLLFYLEQAKTNQTPFYLSVWAFPPQKLISRAILGTVSAWPGSSGFAALLSVQGRLPAEAS